MIRKYYGRRQEGRRQEAAGGKKVGEKAGGRRQEAGFLIWTILECRARSRCEGGNSSEVRPARRTF